MNAFGLHKDDGTPVTLSVSEGLALLSLTYILSIATFNAAYFGEIPGRYENFISLTDLFGANLPLLDFFFGVFTTYCTLWFATSWIVRPLWQRIRGSVEKNLLLHHQDTILFYAGFVLLLGTFVLCNLFISQMANPPLSLKLTPFAIFQGALIYHFWVGHKNDYVTLTSLAFVCFMAVFVFSHQAGQIWIRYEIKNPRVQAISLSSGFCIDRMILRATSYGLLLYSPELKQFELRSKDDIKTIFPQKGCA